MMDTTPSATLAATDILFLHDRIIQRLGGEHGVRDPEMLRQCLSRLDARVGEEEVYGDVFEKAAVLLHSLYMTRPFADGNERTGLAAAGLLLARTGRELEAPAAEALDLCRRVSSGEYGWRAVADWLRRHAQKARLTEGN